MKNLFIIGLLFVWFFNLNLAFAWPNDVLEDILKKDNTKNETIVDSKFDPKKQDFRNSQIVKRLIPNSIKLMFYLAATFAVIWVIYWWVQMFTAGWEEEKYYNWWKSFSYSLVWLLLIIMSRTIVSIVESVKISDRNVAWESETVWDDIYENSEFIWNLPTWELWSDIVPTLINGFLNLISLAIVIALIYVWIVYLTENDDDKRWKMWSIFIEIVSGLIVILTSYALISWVLSIDF